MSKFERTKSCVTVILGEAKPFWLTKQQRNLQVGVVRADEKLTAFGELERAIHEFAVDLIA